MGGVFSVNAQDLIILRDGNIIEARVLEISPTEIRYRRFDHLDGPIIVIMAANVLSIRYENGRTEIINSVTQPATRTSNTASPPTPDLLSKNPRLNTIGVTLGYQGVSAFGLSAIGTVSPSNYTFFDFNLGLGFNSFAFNGRVNFNVFVPFNTGGWYAGIGIGGGYNELFGGVFAGNITTGFLLFNWLNIAYTLQIGTFDNIINHNIAIGYSYRFKQTGNVTESVTQSHNNVPTRIQPVIEIAENFTVERIAGNVQRSHEGTWVNVNIGDIINKDTLIRTSNNSFMVLTDGYTSFTIPGNVFHRLEHIIINNLR